jgi:hypothetical protein
VTEEVFGEGSGVKFTENASESSEDYIKPDCKVQDENRDTASENLDEEIGKLVKLEQLSSETSFEMHSQTLSPTPSQSHFLSFSGTRPYNQHGADVQHNTRPGHGAGFRMGLAHAARDLSHNSGQDCR